jgi:acetyltransferase-like isoleucine patch superfamily enzyme
MPGMTRARELAKRRAPHAVAEFVQWRRDVWGDARLRLLADLGRVPSHSFRTFFYRQAGLTLPRSSSIHWRAEFYAPERIVIGDHTVIGDSAFLDGRSGLTIGSNVNLGSHVSVYTLQHDIDSADFAEVGGPVAIEDYAYVGSHAIVLPSVRIGHGGVVGAGSVVTHDVEPFTFVAGVPARFVRRRPETLTYQLGYAKRFV